MNTTSKLPCWKASYSQFVPTFGAPSCSTTSAFHVCKCFDKIYKITSIKIHDWPVRTIQTFKWSLTLISSFDKAHIKIISIRYNDWNKVVLAKKSQLTNICDGYGPVLRVFTSQSCQYARKKRKLSNTILEVAGLMQCYDIRLWEHIAFNRIN